VSAPARSAEPSTRQIDDHDRCGFPAASSDLLALTPDNDLDNDAARQPETFVGAAASYSRILRTGGWCEMTGDGRSHLFKVMDLMEGPDATTSSDAQSVCRFVEA